jgi:hypothetical protein
VRGPLLIKAHGRIETREIFHLAVIVAPASRGIRQSTRLAIEGSWLDMRVCSRAARDSGHGMVIG